MNEAEKQSVKWAENIIIVDAEYVDKVAFYLIVNFERMIGRRIPPADLARWIDCVALDGGLRPADTSQEATAQTSVIFLHEQATKAFDNFKPAQFQPEINGMAFADGLGEFLLTTVNDEGLTTKTELLADIVQTALGQSEVKRIMIVPDGEDDDTIATLRHTLRLATDDKRVTLFAMQPVAGGSYRQEILGYSLMNALGIRSDEL